MHCDIWGSRSQEGYTGARYFLTLVDDYKCCTWVYMMNTKSQTCSYLLSFHSLVSAQFQTKIKCSRSDNGPEFAMVDFYDQNGIIHQRTCVDSPQQNGVAECKLQHILNIARALKIQSGLSLIYWPDMILTTVYLINRTPSPQLHNLSPYELRYGHPPSYTHIRSFGCLCYAATIKSHLQKFDPRAQKCLFFGYPFGVKGYKVLDLLSHYFHLPRRFLSWTYFSQ